MGTETVVINLRVELLQKFDNMHLYRFFVNAKVSKNVAIIVYN